MAIITKHSALGFLVGFASCLLLGVGGLVLLAVFARSLTGPGLALPPPPVPTARAVDYHFAFKDLTGAPQSLEQFQGQVVVLNFWATWCGPCLSEMPSLARLHRSLAADPDVAVLCVSREPLAVIKDKKIADIEGLPLYSCADSAIPPGFSTRAIPATFIIGRDGRVAFSHVGSADWSDQSVADLIRSLKSARLSPEDPARTRP